MIKVFEGKVTAHVPNDNRLVESINRGTPLAVNAGDSPWMQAMETLADMASGIQTDTRIRKILSSDIGLRWWKVNGTA
jgi:MinD-like ATPase involved in chromosome partitioning or flagellar assembly